MIDPATAALYSIIAICFVLVGAILTLGPVSVEQRAAVLAGIFAALSLVAWRNRRHSE